MKRLASHPRFFVATLVLGMLLGLSALRVGFYTDDYSFIAHLEAPSPHRGPPWALYEFASGDEHATFELMKRGPYPWWTAPDLKLRFLRPLSSGLFALDHALFGHHPFGYHLHTYFWYVALLCAVGLLLRCVLAPPLLGMSMLVYVLAQSHAEPLAWISSRHLLISTTPALLGLAAHIHRREHLEGRLARLAWGGWLAPVGLVLGLFGGEAAISVAVYWLAYDACGAPEPGGRRARLRNLAVPLAILTAYLLTYKALGYGVRHSEAYVDAMESPLTFASTVFWRLPLLLGEVLLGVPSALAYNVFPKVGALVGLLGAVLVAVLLRTVWSELAPSSRRAVRWLLCGAFLSMLIGLGGIPGARLVVIPGIGASVVLGAILTHGWRRWATSRWPARSAGRAGVALLVMIHVALAPLTFLASVQMIATMGKKTAEIDASLDGLMNERHALVRGPLQVIILAASDPLAGLYVWGSRAMRAPGSVDAWIVLSMARATHTIERTSEDTLVIETDPSMMRGSFETVFRPSGVSFRDGERFVLANLVVTILSTEEGRPRSLEVRFIDAKMDDPNVCLLAWREGNLTPVRLANHEKVVIPWTSGPTGIF